MHGEQGMSEDSDPPYLGGLHRTGGGYAAFSAGKRKLPTQVPDNRESFADAKEKYGMRYTPYRGLKRVHMWVRLKYVAMNLKKLAMWKRKAVRRQFIVTISMAAFKKNLCCAAA